MRGPRFSGVMPALATPLREDGSLDREGLARLIRHVLVPGVTAICPVGSTGEGPHLGAGLQFEVIRAVCQEAAGRAEVIPAVAACSLSEARHQIRKLASLEVAAVLVPPPFYYLLPAQAVESFFLELAEDSPLPILLYNIPRFTQVPIAPPSVRVLSQHERIVGIKDSSRDLEYYQSVLAESRHRPDFSVLTGSDTILLGSLLAGGHGLIGASVNVAPSWAVALYNAARSGQWESANELQSRIARLVAACRSGTFPAGFKAALSICGICEPHPAPPIPGLPAHQVEHLHRTLAELGLAAEAELPPIQR